MVNWILHSWIEKLDFIGNISPIYRISGGLEMKFNTDYWTGGISAKYRQYISLELINRRKNWAWSDVRSSGGSPSKVCQNIGNISVIYRIYWQIYQIYRRYIGEILEIFLKTLKKKYSSFFLFFYLFFIFNLYYHFIFNYFLYLSHLCMTCSYLQSILLKFHVLVWILSSTRWTLFIYQYDGTTSIFILVLRTIAMSYVLYLCVNCFHLIKSNIS